MEFKEVVIADASTEAKVAALALLVDKRLSELANVVLTTKKLQGPKGEQGIQGPKGEQGDRGLDGQAGKDGKDGVDGKDGKDGKEGVGVSNAYVDFDGSLVIELTDGRQINAGEVVAEGAADKIRLVKSGGGNSQPVLDDIAALQAAVDAIETTIASYGTMATQNANNVAITGGTINGTAIGGTTPAAGTFTTLSTGALTATGQTSLGGVAGSESFRAKTFAGTPNGWLEVTGSSTGTNGVYVTSTAPSMYFNNNAGNFRFFTNTASTTEQFRVSHTASAVNYVQVTGAATGVRPAISAQGSDTSFGLAFQAKGTPTDAHVFSNGGQYAQFRIGGSVNAVNYYRVDGSLTGNAPVFAVGGSDTNISQVFQSKGTGAIDLAAGSSGVNISNGGTVTAITRTNNGTGYTSAPTVAITAPTTAGGVQATATATVSAGSLTGITITNAGSGYVEQPTVSFSGGGGSGAAAYATVGSGTVVKSIGSSLAISSPSGTVATFVDGGLTADSGAYLQFSNGATSASTQRAAGANTNISLYWLSKGTGFHSFNTNNATGTQQMVVSHTASAVNYVQVTGAATGSGPTISAQGSDTNTWLNFQTKGTGSYNFFTDSGTTRTAFQMLRVFNSVNYLTASPAATGSAPFLASAGTDTNIDLTLTPKGTGLVRFGTYTAGAPAATGYISIKAADGTTYKVLVGT